MTLCCVGRCRKCGISHRGDEKAGSCKEYCETLTAVGDKDSMALFMAQEKNGEEVLTCGHELLWQVTGRGRRSPVYRTRRRREGQGRRTINRCP